MRLIQKKLLLALGLTVFALGLVGLWALYTAWEVGIFPDCGLEIGYYGQYNRVKHVIESMPNVRIVDHWQHHDMSLEDFGFTLVVDGTRKVRVDLHEGSSEMKERNKDRLREFIQRQIDSNQPVERTG